ncbi:protein FIP1 [Cryptomeria japonica]|uniref:protein FIP1 n=1 Tax=Cryptomeria japonica TaxID=3369 RepID=UPI0025AC9178|nr:protein FIP1 [Cryptomeria japonica]
MARWFDRQSTASRAYGPDNTDMFIDSLREVPLFGHRQPASIFGGLLYCIFLGACAIVVALASWIFSSMTSSLPALLSSGNVFLLIVTSVLQHYLVYQVKKERMQGFYIFSQKLKPIVHLPFSAVSYGIAISLLIIVWHRFLRIEGLSVSTMLRIVIFAEIIWAGGAVALYICNFTSQFGTDSTKHCISSATLLWCLYRHNSLDMQPDVTRSLYSSLQPSNSVEELRYGEAGRLAEQQTALLQYQRENLHYLSEEILRLQECLSKYERTDNGNTLQVDVVHLLAAREQELRALSAERDQLHSELHLARSLIEERDSEIQQTRMINDQYVLENDRLRDIIREWSTNAAKLERALEEEQLSNAELHKKISMLRQSNEESA